MFYIGIMNLKIFEYCLYKVHIQDIKYVCSYGGKILANVYHNRNCFRKNLLVAKLAEQSICGEANE